MAPLNAYSHNFKARQSKARKN